MALSTRWSISKSLDCSFILSAQCSCCRFRQLLPGAQWFPRAHTLLTAKNKLRWVLDVQMWEDDLRNRAGHGPENLASVRRLVISMVHLMDDKLSVRRRPLAGGSSVGISPRAHRQRREARRETLKCDCAARDVQFRRTDLVQPLKYNFALTVLESSPKSNYMLLSS